MESEFLEQWNAKFGAKPPEWVFILTSQFSRQPALEQDVDRELDKCRARVDELRDKLEQELFLVEWLRQQKASCSSAVVAKPPSSPQPSHVQFDSRTGHVEDEQVEQWSDQDLRREEDEESSPRPLVSPFRGHSPGGPLQSRSEESFKSTPDSSEYHTAPQSVCEDPPPTDLEDQKREREIEAGPVDEVRENGVSSSPDSAGRERFAHKVNSSDVSLARAVNKRLFDQGVHHNSCNILNLEDTCPNEDYYLVPVIRKRCASDPSSEQSKETDLIGTSDQPTPPPHSESPLTFQTVLLRGDKSTTKSIPESTTVSANQEFERVGETNLKIIMTSEVEKRSSKEDDSIELRQWANLGPGKRSSNGILDTYEGYIVSPEEERDPALLNVLATQLRSSARSTPRSSIDHLRDSPSQAANDKGRASGDNSPSHRPTYSTQLTLVADRSPGRGVPPALSKPDRGSLVFSEDECITPKGDSDHSMNIPTDEDDSRTKDRSHTLIENPEDTLSSKNVSRVERLLEEVKRTQDRESGEDAAMMTLTRKNIGNFQEFNADHTHELTPLGHLDIDIQETLSKIQSTPEMSMATLLDVGENKEMNANLPPTFADPSFDDFEYNEMEIDEATISALTLSNELLNSRSNSVSSLPGLYSGGESTTSISPPDTDSPLHRQGVNLRHTGGARRRDRKRMGNAELDMIAGASDEGSDLSPSHTVSSRSMSPTSELGSLASLTVSPSSPRELSGSDSSCGIMDSMVSINMHVCAVYVHASTYYTCMYMCLPVSYMYMYMLMSVLLRLCVVDTSRSCMCMLKYMYTCMFLRVGLHY